MKVQAAEAYPPQPRPENRVQRLQPPPQKPPFCRLSLKDLLTVLFSAVLPIAVAVHTLIVSRMETQRIHEQRQQQIYDQFLDNIYKLHTDKELNESVGPWAFANARYRSAHRQWDLERKQQSIQFLKEKYLIGRHAFNIKNGSVKIGCLHDVIRLKQLNFDNLIIQSTAKDIFRVNLTCIHFEQSSMDKTHMSSVDLSYALFDRVRLNNAVFVNASLTNTIFSGCDVEGTDFGDSDMTNAIFISSDLSKVNLKPDQASKAKFFNVTAPASTKISQLKTAPGYRIVCFCANSSVINECFSVVVIHHLGLS